MSISEMPCVTIEQVTRMRHAAMKLEEELTTLRAYKAAIEAQEAVWHDMVVLSDGSVEATPLYTNVIG